MAFAGFSLALGEGLEPQPLSENESAVANAGSGHFCRKKWKREKTSHYNQWTISTIAYIGVASMLIASESFKFSEDIHERMAD